MSSFKTQTGPGTIYDQLLNPGPGANIPESQEDSAKTGALEATGPEVEDLGESLPKPAEKIPTAFSSVSGDPKS